jgi:hypothetical protein
MFILNACGIYGGEEFWWGSSKERDQLGDQSIDGRIILKLSSINRMVGSVPA